MSHHVREAEKKKKKKEERHNIFFFFCVCVCVYVCGRVLLLVDSVQQRRHKVDESKTTVFSYSIQPPRFLSIIVISFITSSALRLPPDFSLNSTWLSSPQPQPLSIPPPFL